MEEQKQVVEKAWKELKEGIVRAAIRVCGIVKKRRNGEKRSRWWNGGEGSCEEEETFVQEAIGYRL